MIKKTIVTIILALSLSQMNTTKATLLIDKKCPSSTDISAPETGTYKSVLSYLIHLKSKAEGALGVVKTFVNWVIQNVPTFVIVTAVSAVVIGVPAIVIAIASIVANLGAWLAFIYSALGVLGTTTALGIGYGAYRFLAPFIGEKPAFIVALIVFLATYFGVLRYIFYRIKKKKIALQKEKDEKEIEKLRSLTLKDVKASFKSFTAQFKGKVKGQEGEVPVRSKRAMLGVSLGVCLACVAIYFFYPKDPAKREEESEKFMFDDDAFTDNEWTPDPQDARDRYYANEELEFAKNLKKQKQYRNQTIKIKKQTKEELLDNLSNDIDMQISQMILEKNYDAKKMDSLQKLKDEILQKKLENIDAEDLQNRLNEISSVLKKEDFEEENDDDEEENDDDDEEENDDDDEEENDDDDNNYMQAPDPPLFENDEELDVKSKHPVPHYVPHYLQRRALGFDLSKLTKNNVY